MQSENHLNYKLNVLITNGNKDVEHSVSCLERRRYKNLKYILVLFFNVEIKVSTEFTGFFRILQMFNI